jgi:hypothetical protein
MNLQLRGGHVPHPPAQPPPSAAARRILRHHHGDDDDHENNQDRPEHPAVDVRKVVACQLGRQTDRCPDHCREHRQRHSPAPVLLLAILRHALMFPALGSPVRGGGHLELESNWSAARWMPWLK